MADMTYYTYNTKVGTLSIVPDGQGYTIMFGGKELGQFNSAEAACKAIAEGEVQTGTKKRDLSKLDIPTNLNKWDYLDIGSGDF